MKVSLSRISKVLFNNVKTVSFYVMDRTLNKAPSFREWGVMVGIFNGNLKGLVVQSNKKGILKGYQIQKGDTRCYKKMN